MPRAPKVPISRSVTKTGEVRYYQGKTRLPANQKTVRNYIRQEYPFTDYIPNLSAKEKKSIQFRELQSRQQDRQRFAGRYINKNLEKVLKEFNLIDPKNKKDLSKVFGTKMYGKFVDDIQKIIPQSKNQTEYALPNTLRKRTEFESTFDIVKSLEQDIFKDLVVRVKTENGTYLTGKKALEYIRDWEIKRVQQAVKDGFAYIKFNHKSQINLQDGFIDFDLEDTDTQEFGTP